MTSIVIILLGYAWDGYGIIIYNVGGTISAGLYIVSYSTALMKDIGVPVIIVVLMYLTIYCSDNDLHTS